MRFDDPVPFAMAEEDVVQHAHDMAPIARLAARGMRMGRLVDDHPRSPEGPEGEPTQFGLLVDLDPSDQVFEADSPYLDPLVGPFHLVVDVEFQFIDFHILPVDRTKRAFVVRWSMREDRSELDFDSPMTNHDVASIADRAALMLESVVDASSPEAIAAADELEDVARTLRLIAFVDLSLPVDVDVLSNDHGSDVIAIASVSERADLLQGRHVRFDHRLLTDLALPRARVKIGMGSGNDLRMEAGDGTYPIVWPAAVRYSVNRMSASSTHEDDHGTVDVMEAMRLRAEQRRRDEPLAFLGDEDQERSEG